MENYFIQFFNNKGNIIVSLTLEINCTASEAISKAEYRLLTNVDAISYRIIVD